MEATTSAGSLDLLNVQEAREFQEALRGRRTQVYDYLDVWPGAANFKPQDIHDALFSYVQARGKALRPILLLLCCGAVGGDEQQAIPAAAAVEIFHTWTLVHDDIIDRDDTRRGHPTVHALYRDHARLVHGQNLAEASHYGLAVAILAGDLQQSWTYALLGDLLARGVNPGLVLELTQRMSVDLTPKLLEGELLDVQFALLPPESLSEDRILHMLDLKTGALLEYAAWCGVTLGLKGKADTAGFANKLGEFARLAGTAFQLRDDLLGLTADQSELGKPVGSDIREGKRTLVVYRALQHAHENERTLLLSVLGKAGASTTEIASVMDILHSTRAIEGVTSLANAYVERALSLLEELPSSPHRDLLRSWALFLMARTH